MSVLAAASGTAPPTNEVQSIVWVIGIFISAITIGGGMTLWITRNFSQTREQLYRKIGFVERELKESIKNGADACKKTEGEIALLKQAHTHIEKQMDEMGDKIDVVLKDVAGTKDQMNKLEQKVGEQHMSVLGAIQGIGDKILISELQKQVNK